MFCDDISGIVVHVGHLKSYIGFIGDELPLFQSDSYFYQSKEDPDSFVLLDEFSHSMDLTNGIITPLISQRRINSPENYARYVSQLASKINVDLQEVAIFLTTNSNDGFAQERKELMTHFFETANSPAMFFSNKNLTSVFASGKHTGMVVDSGAYFTEVISVYQGHLLKKSMLISL